MNVSIDFTFSLSPLFFLQFFWHSQILFVLFHFNIVQVSTLYFFYALPLTIFLYPISSIMSKNNSRVRARKKKQQYKFHKRNPAFLPLFCLCLIYMLLYIVYIILEEGEILLFYYSEKWFCYKVKLVTELIFNFCIIFFLPIFSLSLTYSPTVYTYIYTHT